MPSASLGFGRTSGLAVFYHHPLVLHWTGPGKEGRKQAKASAYQKQAARIYKHLRPEKGLRVAASVSPTSVPHPAARVFRDRSGHGALLLKTMQHWAGLGRVSSRALAQPPSVDDGVSKDAGVLGARFGTGPVAGVSPRRKTSHREAPLSHYGPHLDLGASRGLGYKDAEF